LSVCGDVVGAPGDVARWSVAKGCPDGVSVSSTGNVVIAVRDNGYLVIYTPTGQLAKEIKLPSELVSPRHAFQLENDQFLLCHGWGKSAYGIYVVDAEGRTVRSSSAAATEGLPARKCLTPTHMVLDRHGKVLVAEFSGNTVQMYSKQLEYMGDVVAQSAGLKVPFRLCLDHATGRLYVGEYTGGARVLVFGK